MAVPPLPIDETPTDRSRPLSQEPRSLVVPPSGASTPSSRPRPGRRRGAALQDQQHRRQGRGPGLHRRSGHRAARSPSQPDKQWKPEWIERPATRDEACRRRDPLGCPARRDALRSPGRHRYPLTTSRAPRSGRCQGPSGPRQPAAVQGMPGSTGPETTGRPARPRDRKPGPQVPRTAASQGATGPAARCRGRRTPGSGWCEWRGWCDGTSRTPTWASIGDVAPASPAIGQFWWESDSGTLSCDTRTQILRSRWTYRLGGDAQDLPRQAAADRLPDAARRSDGDDVHAATKQNTDTKPPDRGRLAERPRSRRKPPRQASGWRRSSRAGGHRAGTAADAAYMTFHRPNSCRRSARYPQPAGLWRVEPQARRARADLGQQNFDPAPTRRLAGHNGN